jgi:4-hydroxybenzoate polyprenyltransferase
MAQSNIKDWAQLVRVPNTFTAATDPLAGLCIASATVSFVSHPISALLVALGSILLYWGGMVLNDVFDYPEDQKNQRPGPIVRGAIGLGLARNVGWAMLAIGWLFACLAAYLIHGKLTLTPLVGALLVGAIIGYDGLFKTTPMAPALMGLCRGLNLSLGMAVAAGSDFATLPIHLWLYPIAFGLYVMGFTIAARKEFLTEQSRIRLWAGWLTCLAGILLLAWIIWKYPSPSLAKLVERRGGWSEWFFPGLMILLSMPVFRRALASIQSLRGPDLGLAIRTAIINILFIDATLALIYKGPWHGLLLAMLIFPTIYLARVFRST